jgi:hypothetical protein
MRTYDYHSVAFEIAQNLRKQGQAEWAAKLEEAIQFGSTGTEILMALRWHLQQFKLQGEKCTPETEYLIEELLRELDKQLK